MNLAHPRVLASSDQTRRLWRNRLALAAYPLAASRAFFPAILRSALRQPSPGAFALHPRWAQGYYGQRLIVNPATSRITHYLVDWTDNGRARIHTSDYFLAYGDLGRISRNIGDLAVLQEARELLDAGWQFEKTNSYATLHRLMKSGRPKVRQQVVLDTEEKLKDYFLRFRALYESIVAHGLLPNRHVATRLSLPQDREIGIAVDRNGRLIKLPGGQHRFALALAMNMKTVPVELRMIHADQVLGASKRHSVRHTDAVPLIAASVETSS